MSWVKIDDAFLDHPKFLGVGPVAGFLALCAVAWSNRNLTDGFIPRRQVARLANLEGIVDETNGPTGDYIHADDLAAALIEAGLWLPAEGGYQIHDYLEHQQSANTIRARREKDAARKADERAQESKPRPRGVPADSKVQEVRSKKEEEKSPPSPPSGGRSRDRQRFEGNALQWCREVGVDGPDETLLRAYEQAKPWRDPNRSRLLFRAFAADYFAETVTVTA